MAVHGGFKQVFLDNGEDDDGPTVFRRTNPSSKQNQLSSASKNGASQKGDDSIGKHASIKQNASTNINSSLQKDKIASSSNTSAEKHKVVRLSSLASSQHDSSDSSGQKLIATSNVKSSHLNKSRSKSSDDSDDEKPLSLKLGASTKGNNLSSVQKMPKQFSSSGLVNRANDQTIVNRLPSKEKSSYDSDDDNIPLSAKFSSAAGVSQKCKSLVHAKENIRRPLDDSEDEKPLVFRLQAKTGFAASLKSESSEKPLTSKTVANGLVKKELIDGLKSPTTSSKRPHGGTDNLMESSLKKTKVLGSATSANIKQESSVKKEKTDDSDHIPIAQGMKKPVSSGISSKKEIKKTTTFKKDGKNIKAMKDSKYSRSLVVPPGSGGGQKWTTLVHNGVIFPPSYKPHGIKMLYNGQPVDLTPEQEEVATMFAVMKDTDYATKTRFIENFMNDWRQILGKNHIIKKFELCDFTPIYEWHLREKEKKKQMTLEEKKKLKEDKLKQEEKYMWAIVDGVKEKVGNFRVEPPALFRGRGEHPKMGKLKRRILPHDITINIGKEAPIPECPIPGERWKEVKHDNTVTWLAYWVTPSIQKTSSSLKGQSDKEKYEKARMLKDYIQNIRANYTKDFTSKDATKRQIAVATYLIDKLALRAGNEKDDDEADTVGCCTLKVENVTLVPPNKLQFDFLGKDSIRYFNTVEVEVPVYKAIGEFQTAKKTDGKRKVDGDDLFDLLDTSKLNAHLKELMPGLTAKVFRTFNASITLDVMLSEETKGGNVQEKHAVYQIANKEVAIICNHQRTVSKSHEAQMSRLNEKIDELKVQRKEIEVDLSKVKKGKPLARDSDGKPKKNVAPEVLEKKIAQIDHKIEKMELSKRTKEDLKTVALGTSKINYLDPRITVAWCKRNEVPIEKIFNKSLLAKFAWAMDVDPEFRF
ncbi:hypothetical protein HPP92_027760 [Vanilla planifolia]|uniref:DNA topoisomerase I n=1 Tax=Vanilla planifolia TaxID=51239 RepID=A0A835U515_VANPL|nr:hypothetical protein HPP92_027760 [Vanilla planifolia]